jgi:hypothetical protein
LERRQTSLVHSYSSDCNKANASFRAQGAWGFAAKQKSLDLTRAAQSHQPSLENDLRLNLQSARQSVGPQERAENACEVPTVRTWLPNRGFAMPIGWSKLGWFNTLKDCPPKWNFALAAWNG